MSLGSHASADVGYASAEIGAYSGGTNIAEGAALLFATNLAGIVITAGTIFVAHGYGQTLKAVLGLTIACIASIGLLHPLGVSLYKLHVKSVAMNTVIATRKAMPRLYDDAARIEGVRVQFKGHTVHLNIDVLGSEAGVQTMQEKIDVFQNALSARLRRPVVVEVDLIPVPIRRFVSNGAVKLKQTPVSNSEVGKELGHVDNVQQPVK